MVPLRPWFALLLLLLAPMAALPAQAQSPVCGAAMVLCATTVEVVLSPPTEPVQPMGPFVALPVSIRYTYVPTSFSMATTPIDLRVTQIQPWIQATLSPSTVYAPVDFLPSGPSPVTRVLSAFLLVSTSGDAPAFTQGIVEVQASAHANGNLAPSEGAAQVPVQAGYFGLLAVTAPPSVTLQDGDGVVVPLQLNNLGNAATRVTFELDGATPGVQVTPPPQLTLDSRQQGGDKTSAGTTFALEAKRGFEAGPVVLSAVSRYALDEKMIGGVTKIVVHVTPRGSGDGVLAQTFGGEATALNPLVLGLLSAGLAGTVLLERERRRRKSP